MRDDEHDELGWHVISGATLLNWLRRVEAGETADMVFMEGYVNADREDYRAE